MLPCQRRDPDVVVWDGAANLDELGFDLTVMLGGVLIRKQNDSGRQEVTDVCKLFLSPLTLVQISSLNPSPCAACPA